MKRSTLIPSLAFGVGAALAGAALLANRLRRRGPGSQTNASEAIDDINLRSRPSAEDVVDAGVQHTFPASDPTAVQGAFETAFDREQRQQAATGAPASPETTAAPRSPDWMLRR